MYIALSSDYLVFSAPCQLLGAGVVRPWLIPDLAPGRARCNIGPLPVRHRVSLDSLPVCQFLRDIFPGDPALGHQNHQMVQEIRRLIFDLLRVRILGGDDNLRSLLAAFLEDLVDPFVKQIVGI